MAALLKVENLVLGYQGVAISPPITFSLDEGGITSIVGRNGSGKSTLLKTLLGFQPKLKGSFSYTKGVRIGYVPQRESIDSIYPLQTWDLVEAGRFPIRGFGRRLTAYDEEVIRNVMESTGIANLGDRLFSTLSGGEQQRALLARALCAEPTILVLDEPTASMDERGAREAMDLALKLAREKKTSILMVNHFLDMVRKISNQVIYLDRERLMVRVGAPNDFDSLWKGEP